MTNLERLLVRVKFSQQLTEEELTDFAAFFLWADDRDLGVVVDAISRQPSFIQTLYKNLQAKQQAAKSQDPEAWNRILESEVNSLS